MKMVDEATMSSRSFSGRVRDDKANRSGRSMVLPFQPLSFTFDEIKYSIDIPHVFYFSSCTMLLF